MAGEGPWDKSMNIRWPPPNRGGLSIDMDRNRPLHSMGPGRPSPSDWLHTCFGLPYSATFQKSNLWRDRSGGGSPLV